MATDTQNGDIDTTGRDRIVKNVFTSWGSHFVLIVVGFVMPRMIDTHLGQHVLGIWDLSWSFVHYLQLSGLGVGSSVSRYVAKYNSAGDVINLNKAVSSVVAIQAVIAVMVVIATGVLVYFLPGYLDDWNPEELSMALMVVGLLGVSLAIQMLFDSFRGVTTGVHRWDLHNGLNAAASLVAAILMIVVLLLGYSIVALAVVYLCVNILAELVRVYIGYKVCPQLDLKRQHVSTTHVRKMFKYGMKTVVVEAPPQIVIQSVNIALAGALGAATLAVFMRPIALLRHIETFMNKFAHVLTPTVGSLIGVGKSEEIKGFLIQSTRYSAMAAYPMILVLAILGDHVMTIWMGHDYANVPLIAILAMGGFFSISQGPVLRVLMGMNLHGKLAIITFAVSIVILVLGVLVLNAFGWSLVGGAILTSSIMIVTRGIIFPVYACRKIGISLFQYLKDSFAFPLFASAVFSAWLFLSRHLGGESSYTVLLLGLLGVGLLMPLMYWPYIKPFLQSNAKED